MRLSKEGSEAYKKGSKDLLGFARNRDHEYLALAKTFNIPIEDIPSKLMEKEYITPVLKYRLEKGI
jgi:hypothetical protein